MALILKEEVKSKDLKKGDHITKGIGSPVFEVHSVTSQVRISKIGEVMVVGFPKDVFDNEKWHRCVDDEVKKQEGIIERQRVDSSNIKSVGYNKELQILEVEFEMGGVYQYTAVPEAVHKNFMNAPSKGNFFAMSIKGAYPYKKV